ncbi:MAG: hypothetical protein KBS44_04360, partial [Clostridiales bacterium]|nr:hypothetical protein [Candidatus Coliplasma equi]
DKAVPTEGNIASENVALGCGTEYLFNTTTTSYLGDLTDGFLPSYSYSSTDPKGNKAWRTFPAKTVTGAEISADAIIDLGEEYNNIASIRAYVSQQNSSGIHLPTGIKAYASNDGEAWLDIGSFDCSVLVTTKDSDPAWVYLSFTNYLDARYIKISVDNGTAAGFSFLGEVEVNTAELAETAYINDINSYNWGAETDARQYGPILAFGDKKTAAQAISGTTDGGLWFGWWTYVRATWDVDEGAFIVKSLHRAADGEGSEYKTEVMGPYDIVLLTSTAAGAGSYSYEISNYIWDNVEIGDKLYLYGLETLSGSLKGQLEIGEGGEITSQYAVSFKTAALGEDYLYIVNDPAGKTDVDTPYLHTSENLALNKPVTYNASLSSYVGDITDGVKPATGYDGKVWRGLYADTPGNFVIDLGEKYENIGSVNVYHWPTKASGITPANYLKVSVSNDGLNYTEGGELDMTPFKDGASGAFNTSVEFDKLVAGRYVRIDFAGHWVFFGEVEVFGYEAIPGAQLLSSYYYGVGEKAILATWLMGDKIDDLNPNLKTHAYWNFASAAWDFEKGAFVVNEVVTGDGSTSDFGDFAIPDFGVVIGAHQTAQAATAQFIAGLKAGDTLYFTENADITNLNAVGIDLDNVWVSTEELGNAYTLAEKYPILTNAGFAGGDITILVPFGTTNTFGGIYEALTGESTDYNYYTAFVVDAGGKIIAKYLDLGRPAGVKTDVVIPDGGFAIAYNGGSSIVTNAKLGDTVILNGTTVAALAKAESDFAAEFALDDQLVWNDTLTDVSYSKYHAHEYIDKVVAPTCTEDGYTEHKCLCGEELDHTDIVAAAGHPDLTAVELQTHPSTCVEHGYTYKVCPACNEEVVIESGLPLIDHDHVETAIGPFVKHVCSVCGDYYYTDAKGNTEGIKDIKISHFISFNWNTFEAMIIPGDGTKTPNQIQTNGSFALGSYKAYLLEATDVAGVYYASAFADNAATYKDTTLAVGQYLLLFSGNNDMYSFASTGALKGWYFADHNAELATSKSYAIDTSASEPRHMYAMFVSADYTEYNNAVEAAGNLVETDWTAESWANLQTALAVDVKGCSIDEQEKVDNATAAIRTAINNLVKVAADIVLGDFDGDNEFTSDDLIYACQLDANLITATEAQLAALDVDGDGSFTSDDLIYMCQYDAGVITVWPADAEPVE